MTERRSFYPPCACPKCRERTSRAEAATIAASPPCTVLETRSLPAPTSAPHGSEIPCEACGARIVKTRRARRFCSDRCRDVYHGRRKSAGFGMTELEALRAAAAEATAAGTLADFFAEVERAKTGALIAAARPGRRDENAGGA